MSPIDKLMGKDQSAFVVTDPPSGVPIDGHVSALDDDIARLPTPHIPGMALCLEDEAFKRDFPGFTLAPSFQGTGVWVGQRRLMAQTY